MCRSSIYIHTYIHLFIILLERLGGGGRKMEARRWKGFALMDVRFTARLLMTWGSRTWQAQVHLNEFHCFHVHSNTTHITCILLHETRSYRSVFASMHSSSNRFTAQIGLGLRYMRVGGLAICITLSYIYSFLHDTTNLEGFFTLCLW